MVLFQINKARICLLGHLNELNFIGRRILHQWREFRNMKCKEKLCHILFILYSFWEKEKNRKEAKHFCRNKYCEKNSVNTLIL